MTRHLSQGREEIILMKTDEPIEKRFATSLDLIADLGELISSHRDFTTIVNSSLHMILDAFAAPAGAVLRYDYEKKSIHPLASKGTGVDDVDIEVDREVLRWFLENKRPVACGALEPGGPPAPPAPPAPDASGETEVAHLSEPDGARTYRPCAATAQTGRFARRLASIFGARLVAPLVVRDEFLGLLLLCGPMKPLSSSGASEIKILSILTQQLASTLQSHSLLKKLMHKYQENKTLYENLSLIYYETILAFSAAIDAKDVYTKGHSQRVSAYASSVTKEMGWSDEETEGIGIAGLLHDVGKIAIDKSIINKPSRLTSVESTQLNCHPVIGYEILSKIRLPWKGISRVIRHHHERVDGTGYPDRLAGPAIPVGAKVLALADSFDAMTTDRPYRKRLSFEEAMAEIEDNLGRQFDPMVVVHFVSVIVKELDGKVERPSVTSFLAEDIRNDRTRRYLADLKKRLSGTARPTHNS
ncbi:MAG TPA: HD domain-containing protein [Deltaproteobacteria bacterium]|nr:HD domain-containing protein [Deltaproteobacteria bacterium]